MNAEDARKIAKNNLESVVIKRFIGHIDNRIRDAARKGKTSIHNPQIGKPGEGDDFYLVGSEKKAVKRYYVSLGFEWVEHPDPDPGHPYGGAYDTLGW